MHFRHWLLRVINRLFGPMALAYLKKLRSIYRNSIVLSLTVYGKLIKNRLSKMKYQNMNKRYLEIGPGNGRIPGFETVNIIYGKEVDYIYDASCPLPFADNTFDIIYASHVLEHIPWYKTEEVLKEWVRILKSGGHLEIWVPDGFKILKILAKSEEGTIEEIPDDWNVFNPRNNPYVWVNGRLLYGARRDYPSWHKALFTPKYLKQIFEAVGLFDVFEMGNSEVRTKDHGWINLGIKGIKP